MARVKNRTRVLKKNKIITPKQLKNFIHNNTLQDWLQRFYNPKPLPISRYMDKFKQSYRDYVLLELKKRLKTANIKAEAVVLHRPDINDINTGEELSKVLNGAETLKHISANVGIIANAQLVNRSEGLCDIVDLLIRADLIPILFPTVPDLQLESLNRYICVGISTSRNKFCVDGLTLLNSPSVRYWKTKLCMANRVLTYYQQAAQDSWCGLLIGRGFSWTTSKKDSGGGVTNKGENLSRPGVIDFTRKDKFVNDLICEGTGWLNNLDREDSKNWRLYPTPSRSELYANAKLSIYETQWAPIIHDIAVKQDNVTLLHHCTVKNRVKAGNKRLSEIKDSKTLGYISTTNLGKKLTRYLQGDWNKISDIPLPKMDNYICLDFESAPVYHCNNGSPPTAKEWIYMVSAKVHGNKVQTYGLTTDILPINTIDFQENVEKDISMKLVELFNKYKYPIICWGDAELRYMNLLATRYPEHRQLTDQLCNIVNLMELFQSNDIILKGQTDYTLGTVLKVMNIPGANKTPVNTHDLLYRSMNGSKGALKQLVEYNSNDTIVLEEMVKKINGT